MNHPHLPTRGKHFAPTLRIAPGVATGVDDAAAVPASAELPLPYWNPRRLTLLAVPLLLLPGLALAVEPVDSQIVAALRDDFLPGDLRKAVNLAEAFAHGIGAVFIFGILLSVDRRRRRQLLIALAMMLAAMSAANFAKSAVSRIRPHAAVDFPELTSSWRPQTDYGFWDSRIRSFPSGHAATAAAMALALGGVYPRGRLWFAALAVAACLQRIIAAAHYPSDVLGGIAIASLVAILWPWDYLSREFDDPEIG